MEKKYIDDLKEIKDIMNRSTRFISLSGLSGISTGITALLGALIAYLSVFKGQDYLVYRAIELNSETVKSLLFIAIGTLIIAIAAALFFTRIKTKNQNKKAWDIQTKRLLVNLIIPLFTGGLLVLMLLLKGFIGILPPLTLIFYGLALVNGSKYTFTEIRTLGLIEIFLGLIAFQFIEYGILFWAFGFGVLQIVYGFIIHRKNSL
ncbi:MAG: hypothetical protein JW857_03460 [Bacteroidales bacterium]|nr:hypothetical protein [Bacteroidales bacterium]